MRQIHNCENWKSKIKRKIQFKSEIKIKECENKKVTKKYIRARK